MQKKDVLCRIVLNNFIYCIHRDVPTQFNPSHLTCDHHCFQCNTFVATFLGNIFACGLFSCMNISNKLKSTDENTKTLNKDLICVNILGSLISGQVFWFIKEGIFIPLFTFSE